MNPSSADTHPDDASSIARIFHGTIIHSLSLAELEILRGAWLGVRKNGTIAFVHKEQDNKTKDLLEREYNIQEGAEWVTVPSKV